MNRAMRRAETSMQRKQKHRPSRMMDKHIRNLPSFVMMEEKPKVDRRQLGKYILYINLGQGNMCHVSEKLWELLNNKGIGLDVVAQLCPLVWEKLKDMVVGQMEIFPVKLFPSLHGVVMHFCKDDDTFMVGLEEFYPYPN